MRLIDMGVPAKAFFLPFPFRSPFKPVVDVHFPLQFRDCRFERYRAEELPRLQQCTPFERQGFHHGFD